MTDKSDWQKFNDLEKLAEFQKKTSDKKYGWLFDWIINGCRKGKEECVEIENDR